MQIEREQDMLRAKAATAYEQLLALFGDNPLVPRREPMHELISTMLSHRTTGANEDKAYRQMWQRFGSWEAIRDAPAAELAEAIAPANFAEAKAPKIQQVVGRIIAERGAPTIDFLRDLPLGEAMAWLTDLPGVGPKTASLVLLFCFAKPILPVDTHVHRVSQRLGLIGPKVNPTAAHPLLMGLLPHDAPWLYNFHLNLLRHGQRICTWSRPRCGQCPLTEICDYYQAAARPASQAKEQDRV